MTAFIEKQLFSVADYYKLAEVGILKNTDRVELINGEILKMSPINSEHSSIVNTITRLLIQKIGDTALVSIQNPIRLDEYSEPEPDILVAEYRDDLYEDSHPTPAETLLLIEVADSSLAYDRKIKTKLYAIAGIREYWVVDVKNRKIEVYTTPFDGEYQNKNSYQPGATITANQLEWTVNVRDILRKK